MAKVFEKGMVVEKEDNKFLKAKLKKSVSDKIDKLLENGFYTFNTYKSDLRSGYETTDKLLQGHFIFDEDSLKEEFDYMVELYGSDYGLGDGKKLSKEKFLAIMEILRYEIMPKCKRTFKRE